MLTGEFPVVGQGLVFSWLLDEDGAPAAGVTPEKGLAAGGDLTEPLRSPQPEGTKAGEEEAEEESRPFLLPLPVGGQLVDEPG